MRGNHHVYAGADPLFYDHPAGSGDQRRFAAADRAVPDGFRRKETTTWIHQLPEGPDAPRLPDQGYKIHVSSTTEDAERVVDIVTEYCLAERVAHKFLPTHRIHLLNNGKYARRGSSGKLLTVYPEDEGRLATVLTDLDRRLSGFTGPYILGDLRFNDGPLYVRYGGFRERWCTDPDGGRTLAIEAPDGTLVPDRRDPYFRLPAWLTPPEVLREALRVHDRQSMDPLPYRVEAALHFSNGGGIYRARDAAGHEVVLREARPLAGLDGAGTDAVTRLDQEERALRALAGLPWVPRLIERFTAWEHHYLAEEYVEGETLRQFMARNNPIVRPDPAPEALAAYGARVQDLTDQLARALDALHERGWAFGDLHPANVLVRPDGRICLIDLETAHRPGIDPSPSMGCPGFVAPHAPDGFARDRYALHSIRLALLLPLTMLIDLDPGKLDELLDAAAEFYPLPPGWREEVRAGLHRPDTPDDPAAPPTAARPTAPRPGAARPRGEDDTPAPAALGARLARALTASATPRRADRLFPGDPVALHDGGYTLAHGAAGVLHTLHTTGHPVDEEHTEWLWRAARRAADPRPGLYGGLHGAALVLDRLGRPGQALELVQRAAPAADASLHDGLAGIGIALHHLHRPGDGADLGDELDAVTARLAERLDDPGPGPHRAGLMHGPTGSAAFFLHRYDAVRDPALLDLALRALRADAERCVRSEEGAVNLRDGTRMLPYLANGSAGLALTAGHYLRHRHDDALRDLLDGALTAARAPFVLFSDLFTGRAGLIALLAAHPERPGARQALRRHLRLLSWHAIGYRDGLAFPGAQHYRLSMDLATGTAGVLHALHAAAGNHPALPGLLRSEPLIPVA
ncbi:MULTISPECIES: class III lanthionine synthetase LanKC [unclassified Streptomyces]|uniref:class III lanthionine synthetase LanKC n=1 Tax=unclassified Streptomyces TaxID=2593676 RepID=UPI0022379572|nr:class III lanthionine synthetase LanKC [Streptomyces sp. SHP 1-2]MCW5249016.1 class III lanthionine synthetase LanKC [Streptomyces sp. SHP 1-2]